MLRNLWLVSGTKLLLRRVVGAPSLVISFNWAKIIFWAFFLVYGYFGALTPSYSQLSANPVLLIIWSVLMMLILAVLGRIAWKTPEPFHDSVELHGRDVLVFLSYLALLATFSYDQLQFSLFGDELAYANNSQLLSLHVGLRLVQYLSVFDNVPFKYVIQFVGLGLLLALIMILAITARMKPRNSIIFVVIAFITSRLVYTALGGNSIPHPPLNLFPPFVASSILGVNDFAFKLSSFLPYVLFVVVLYRMLLRVFRFYTAYLIALAVGTIPLLWHFGAIVEQSIWASICFVLVLVDMITTNRPNYMRLVCLVSVATLMRQPSFLVLFPILLAFALEVSQTSVRGSKLLKSVPLLLPTLLFAPFLGKSLIIGTHSIPTLVNASSMFERVLVAFESDIVWHSLINSIPVWWIVLLPFAFIPVSRTTVAKNIGLLIFFVLVIFVYHSINPSFQGSPKYLAEYGVPFAVAGMLLIALKLEMIRFGGRVLPVFAFILVVLNIVNFGRIPHGNKSVDTRAEEVLAATLGHEVRQVDAAGQVHYVYPYQSDLTYSVLYAYPYQFQNAYDLIKREGLTEHSYSVGVTYGILPEIINGYTTKAVRIIRDIDKRQWDLRKEVTEVPWAGSSVESVEKDDRIKVILLGLVLDKQGLIDQFKARGWQVTSEHRNSRYRTTVVIMRRPNLVVPYVSD